MNKWEKQVQQSLLRDEQQVLRILKMAYESVLADIDAKIGDYAIRILADEEDTAAIYQLQYQQALREQVEKIIGDLQGRNYETIQSYLEGTYENGFIGAMYSIHKQGIPLLLPLNQQNIVRAVTTNSKISVGLYTRLGKDIDVLKTIIAAETTRGIATGSTWHETAVQIRAKGQIPYYNAMRIARAEGHRVQCEGQMDACQDAKAHGADVVKQWDAALDKRTRPLHRQLDGQIRELEEPFEIAGYHAMQPGAFDAPEMDIHCRCAMLQRARWALDEEELETLKERAEYFGLDKTEQFEDFKRKYLDAAEDVQRNQPKTLDISGGSGIIKNIELPAEIETIRSMSTETRKAISDAIEKLQAEYNVHLETVLTKDLGDDFKTVPFQYQHFMENGKLNHALVINSGYYFNDSHNAFQERILRNYNNRVLASQSVEDLVAHELAHIMTFQSAATEGAWLLENRKLSKRCIPGVSAYADASGDGAETIAEAFVRMRNGETVPSEARDLVLEYVERWRK